MTSSEETLRFTCPACLETSELSRVHEEQIMPCPSCGVSAAITDDLKTPPPPVPKSNAPRTPTNDELAYLARKHSTTQFQQAEGFKRVAYRVFRLQVMETWESLFDRTVQFANTLPPEAIINISHSSGRGMGADAATVWYWEVVPMDPARIRALQSSPATDTPSA